ncbi:hypothetical protein AB205_0208460 [Aquarana catesbeiana]|uniref:Uncharacterized protein n=1 Tax=Aquarana catesbeiana TaxID=8400 RepID=A0A2G9NCK1_AQUCT|nr:hypothetical protein AB205_0208460 [Aquarana catesbeiana]
MCDTLPKKVSIPALRKGKIMSSAWNSAKTDNWTTLPSNVSYYYFCPQYLCAKYTFFSHGKKRLRTSEDTRDPQPPKEGEIPTPHPEDVEEGEVYELGEIVTTTGDVDVVEEETHFTSASAQILIREIMVCNRDLQKIKEDINDVDKRLKNIIDGLGII